VTSTSKSRTTSIDPGTAALALVALTIVIALGVGFAVGVASAFLVFVTGALLGAILLVWHSLRTLAGDAEVDPTLEATISTQAPSELTDKKRRALRALKDLEQEHSLGKIDEADYKELAAQYRSQAKDVIREMDDAIAPYREKAEALVQAHLEKQKKSAAKEEEPEADQRACPKCETKNDSDATFCKKCGEKLASEDA
jgi:ribosomal protein L40E